MKRQNTAEKVAEYTLYMIYIIVSGDASSAYRINRGEVGAAGRGRVGVGVAGGE